MLNPKNRTLIYFIFILYNGKKNHIKLRHKLSLVFNKLCNLTFILNIHDKIISMRFQTAVTIRIVYILYKL